MKAVSEMLAAIEAHSRHKDCAALAVEALSILISWDLREASRRTPSAIGRKGGQAISERKARAVRENGKKGGRPKKTTPTL